jgi:hypothetical protein
VRVEAAGGGGDQLGRHERVVGQAVRLSEGGCALRDLVAELLAGGARFEPLEALAS